MENPKLTKQQKRILRLKKKAEEKSLMKRKLFIKKHKNKALLFIFLFLIPFGFYNLVKTPSSSIVNNNYFLPQPNDWIKGTDEAKIILIEYLDFQCPACAIYHILTEKVYEEYKDKIKFIIRHFPLTQIHRNAYLASQAAEAAGRQNKFWEYVDILFKNQKEWENKFNAQDLFIKYAEEINLDINKFKIDIKDNTIKEKIESDIKSGIHLLVDATPTFFLNNKKIQPKSYEEFKTLIDEALNQ